MPQARIRLDGTLLASLGYAALTPSQANRLLAELYDTAEALVGARLSNEMTPAQLDQFEQFMEANDEAGALKWLERNFPNYRQVVAEVFDSLHVELKATAARVTGTEIPGEDA